jgi:hypothetical protein
MDPSCLIAISISVSNNMMSNRVHEHKCGIRTRKHFKGHATVPCIGQTSASYRQKRFGLDASFALRPARGRCRHVAAVCSLPGNSTGPVNSGSIRGRIRVFVLVARNTDASGSFCSDAVKFKHTTNIPQTSIPIENALQSHSYSRGAPRPSCRHHRLRSRPL